jgi:hypothetical protein
VLCTLEIGYCIEDATAHVAKVVDNVLLCIVPLADKQCLVVVEVIITDKGGGVDSAGFYLRGTITSVDRVLDANIVVTNETLCVTCLGAGGSAVTGVFSLYPCKVSCAIDADKPHVDGIRTYGLCSRHAEFVSSPDVDCVFDHGGLCVTMDTFRQSTSKNKIMAEMLTQELTAATKTIRFMDTKFVGMKEQTDAVLSENAKLRKTVKKMQRRAVVACTVSSGTQTEPDSNQHCDQCIQTDVTDVRAFGTQTQHAVCCIETQTDAPAGGSDAEAQTDQLAPFKDADMQTDIETVARVSLPRGKRAAQIRADYGCIADRLDELWASVMHGRIAYGDVVEFVQSLAVSVRMLRESV